MGHRHYFFGVRHSYDGGQGTACPTKFRFMARFGVIVLARNSSV